MSAPLYKHFNLAEVPSLNEHDKEIDTTLFSVDTIIRQQNMDIIHRNSNKNEFYQANLDDILAKDIVDIKTKPYINQGKTLNTTISDSPKSKQIAQPVAASINPKTSFSLRLKEAKDRYNQPSSNISMPYCNGPKIL